VSFNTEYLLISNNSGEEERIKLSDKQLLRLAREIINVLWERNNAV
jgi:hypothetical protein